MSLLEMLNALGSAGNIVAGLAIAVCSAIAWGAMGHRTRHCFRIAYGLLGVGGLGLVGLEVRESVAALFGVSANTGEIWEAFLHEALFVGFAIYLVLDRRRIRPQREPGKAGT